MKLSDYWSNYDGCVCVGHIKTNGNIKKIYTIKYTVH